MLAISASALTLLAVGVGGTIAASNPATLYACFDVIGVVRVSDKNTCLLPGGGRLASWGTVGVPGATGPIGATGPTGATGSTGPAAPVARHTGSITYGQQFVVPGSGTDNTFLLFVSGSAIQLTGHDPRIWTQDGAMAFSPGFGVATYFMTGATGPYTALTTGNSGNVYVWNAFIGEPAGPTGACVYDFYGSY